MPCNDKQMESGNFSEELIARRGYKKNEELQLHEKRAFTSINLARSVVHDVKGMLYEASIALGTEFDVELSHHYSMQHFTQYGAVIINIVNREYCKKLIALLPR